MTVKLAQKAEDDLLAIFLQGIERFGPVQAEAYLRDLDHVFDLLGAHPELGRVRTEITPPVRVHPHRAHIIIYETDGVDGVIILRVRHAAEDWRANSA